MTKVALNQKHPLDPSWRDLKLIELQSELERRGEERGEIAYTSPLWARFSLPHRDPKDAPVWEARNGNISLSVQPGFHPGPDGRPQSAGYPFGVIPRLALTYMATMAVQTKDPVIQLGESQRDFMQRLGVSHGSTDRKRIRRQLEALAACNIQLNEFGQTETGWGYRFQRLPISDGLQLWLNNGNEGQPALWGSTIVLSDEFYESIIDASMPVHLDDLRALGGSSLRHDIYLWLVYRLYKMERSTHITWEQLHEQFGSGTKLVKHFKPKFLEALKDVQRVYTTANVSVTEKTLVLRPSPPQVAPLSRR